MRLRPAPRVELDRRPARAEHRPDARGNPAQLALDVLVLEQSDGHVREQRRLALALLGLRRAPARTRREAADDDRGDEVDPEHDPVLGVAERKRVPRRQEEPVEREHAGDRDGNRVRKTPDDRHREHGEQVEHAEAEYRRDRPQPEDQARRRGNRDGARRQGLERLRDAPHRTVTGIRWTALLT